jgi:EAL domain-containing protein (putative c-di-GMP-specific phosphodiesterase class I)/AmiR/NasT family two-component response regulator
MALQRRARTVDTPTVAGPNRPQLGGSDGTRDALAGSVALVIDDHEANVLLLQRILERAGLTRVVGITDPRDAVAQYRAISPDVILLDLHMPHLDGVAVLGALRAVIPPDSFTPILILTADTTLGAKQGALAAGAKDFVTKPFEQTEVILRVRNLLETRALHTKLQDHNAALEAQLAASAERERQLAAEHDRRRRRVQQALDTEALTMVFQPIVDLLTLNVAGVEALARFPATPSHDPDVWFAEAAAVGLADDLELLAIRHAVAQLGQLPEATYLSVNASPRTALNPRLAEALEAPERVVLELTEHTRVDQYDALIDALAELRHRGLRLAVDDAGSGYASMQHILRLNPDIIKLDIELIRGIDADPARRALASALVAFGADIGATVTAEGIETAAQLESLRKLAVRYGQGYLLGRPAPLQ